MSSRRRTRWLIALLVAGAVVVARTDSPQARGSSDRGLKGTYGIFFVGQSVPSLQPESGIGVATLDGNGSLTGFEIFNTGTQICEVTLSGTYTVAPNGTGRASVSTASPIPACAVSFNLAFVILEGGALLKMTGTDPGFVILDEEWRRTDR